jgi:hypothetical protein
MLLLTSTSDKLQLITGSAVAVDVHASFVDNASGTITPGRQNTAITTATTTDVVAAPGSGTQRNVQTLTIRNKGLSTDHVHVVLTDGATAAELFSASLAAGSSLQFLDGAGWSVFDSSGSKVIKEIAEESVIGAVPIGGIIMWSGTIAAIPADYAFCNGTDNAPGPDLRDKFIVGAKQDDSGVPKSNIEGSLKATGGATGHSHSGHAGLSHSGGAVADHTGFTHGLTIGNHPDLTHAALSHPSMPLSHGDHAVASLYHTHAAITVTHADHSVASQSHTHAAITLTHDSHSLASFTGSNAAITLTHADHSLASFSGTDASASVTIASQAGVASFASGTNRSGVVSVTSKTGSLPSQTHSHAASTVTHADHSVASASHTHAASTLTHADHSVASFSGTDAAVTITHADHSIASFSGTHAAYTLTHGDHSIPSLSHQDIGTHAGTTYGVHSVTLGADHGSAGTVTHAFTQPDAHSISAHDTVSNVPSYYALAFIQRMQ